MVCEESGQLEAGRVSRQQARVNALADWTLCTDALQVAPGSVVDANRAAGKERSWPLVATNPNE